VITATYSPSAPTDGQEEQVFPDLITPKSYPDLLMAPDYDPCGLMPRAFPDGPRVLLNAEQLAWVRAAVRREAWAMAGLARLAQATAGDEAPPERLPDRPDPQVNDRLLGLAQRHALAFLLTGEARHRERALALFRPLARAYPQWPLTGADARAVGGSLRECRFTRDAARTYDLLRVAGLDAADEQLFRDLLVATEASNHGNSHRTCSNHHTWNLVGNLAAGLALGDRRRVHNSLYGWRSPDGQWHYGLIHQLRHDLLADGLHWERTLGYHYYTLMGLTDLADMLANNGVDLWHRELPCQQQNDGSDLHRAYGPNATKSLRVAYDAPLHAMFPGGELPVLHDSGLAHVRGIWIWGIIYNKAWEAYGDPAHAWLLATMEREYPAAGRKFPDLPMPLNTDTGDLDFTRIRDPLPRRGRFSLTRSVTFAPAGRTTHGCSLFPVHGSAVLRAAPADPAAPSAFLFWGPHSAGHQSPAALHLDLHAGGWRRTDGPRVDRGYDDPNYLSWVRTTIAHNTVCVDEAPMFPYDFPTESIWECDQWRDRVSDGEQLEFRAGSGFCTVRAANDRVYPGVRLDRTVVLTTGYALDVFRATGDRPRQYDWAMHGVGSIARLADAPAVALGDRPGYRHFQDAFRLPVGADGTTAVTWQARGGTTRVMLARPTSDAELVAANDLERTVPELGEFPPIEPRTALLVRTRAAAVVFVSLWSFTADAQPGLRVLAAPPNGPVELEVDLGGERCRWVLPAVARPVRRQQKG